MQQNNFIRRLMSITSSLAAIFSAYKSTKADSDFWFTLAVLGLAPKRRDAERGLPTCGSYDRGRSQRL